MKCVRCGEASRLNDNFCERCNRVYEIEVRLSRVTKPTDWRAEIGSAQDDARVVTGALGGASTPSLASVAECHTADDATFIANAPDDIGFLLKQHYQLIGWPRATAAEQRPGDPK